VVRVWVPHEQIAAAIRDLPGVEIEVCDGDGTGREPAWTADAAAPAVAWPASAAVAAALGMRQPAARPAPVPVRLDEIEFHVPAFFVSDDGLAALARMPKLRVVQTQTAGVERFLPHIRPGVTLCNARGVHDASTAEWVVAAILTVLREFDDFARAQAAGSWEYRATDCLDGKTVLIVGYGAVGAAVERRLAGFGVEVARVGRTARPGVAAVTDLPALLPEADIVVLLVPFTPDTAGMVDAPFLARLRDGALLVNAARGPVVVTDALLAELTAGRLHAALDVTQPEPLPPGHPLWTAPNVFITPHLAGSTPSSRARTLDLIRAQLGRYLRGEPLQNVITGAY
jgi:phosphoglycerate dehydrogenase-like enzyme